MPAVLAAAQMVVPSGDGDLRPSIVSVTVRGVACTGIAMYLSIRRSREITST